jgi:choline dehydrogenase-like flavoprotein
LQRGALARQCGEEGIEIMKSAGAEEAWKGPIACQHIMGGAHMGDDPATSVTDGFDRLHDVANLFVAGPSLFPTSSSSNVTFTVHALAFRSADFIAAHWHELI